jgi:hypothetical protein
MPTAPSGDAQDERDANARHQPPAAGARIEQTNVLAGTINR